MDSKSAAQVARLQQRLAATRARLGAQDERLVRLRDDLRRGKAGAPRDRGLGSLAALSLVAVTLAAVVLRQARPLSAIALKDAVASLRRPAAPAEPAMLPPRGDNDVAEGLRLVYAYRPTAASVTVGEILEPLLGSQLKPESWELTPIAGSAFWIAFKPYTDDVGLAHQYRFRVDAAARRVEPTPETLTLLRVDVAGRLASRSDFEGFRQALDLSRDDEVVLGKPADRVSRQLDR